MGNRTRTDSRNLLGFWQNGQRKGNGSTGDGSASWGWEGDGRKKFRYRPPKPLGVLPSGAVPWGGGGQEVEVPVLRAGGRHPLAPPPSRPDCPAPATFVGWKSAAVMADAFLPFGYADFCFFFFIPLFHHWEMASCRMPHGPDSRLPESVPPLVSHRYEADGGGVRPGQAPCIRHWRGALLSVV